MPEIMLEITTGHVLAPQVAFQIRQTLVRMM
jgi:hypothetical protein